MHATVNEIKFKNTMLNSNLCDYIDPKTPAKGTILVSNTITAYEETNNVQKMCTNQRIA